MAKSKPAKLSKADKGTTVKAISSVKEGAVTKPLQTAKAKSKELAKGVAAKAEKVDKDNKKSKKSKKEPTPEPSSESESEDESDSASDSASGSASDSASDSDVEDNQEISSDSSASSDEEAEVELAKPGIKPNGTAVNGLTKAAPLADSESSESSESSDSDAEAIAPKATLKQNSTAVDEGKGDSESESSKSEGSEDESAGDSGDSDEESDEDTKGKSGVNAARLTKKLHNMASSKDVGAPFLVQVNLANVLRRFPQTSLKASWMRRQQFMKRLVLLKHLKVTLKRILKILTATLKRILKTLTKNPIRKWLSRARMRRRPFPPRSAKRLLTLLQPPRRNPRQKRLLAKPMTLAKQNFLSAIFLGMSTRSGLPVNSKKLGRSSRLELSLIRIPGAHEGE